MRLDIMVDIETLGHTTESTIIQIAAIAFNVETGEQYDTFNQIADIELNKVNTITGSTLKWWMKTNKELLNQLLSSGEHSSERVLSNFRQWIITQATMQSLSKENVYLWGNGILFDNKMMLNHLEAFGHSYPIFYKNDRDVRTIVELAAHKLNISEKELKNRYNDDSLVAHDAIDDVKYQISLVVGCYNALIN